MSATTTSSSCLDTYYSGEYYVSTKVQLTHSTSLHIHIVGLSASELDPDTSTVASVSFQANLTNYSLLNVGHLG